MRIEFDPDKNNGNLAKHGLSLALACELDWEAALFWAKPTVERLSTMSKVPESPAVRMPSTAEDRTITAAAKADPNAQPLTAKQLKAMVPLRKLRGRPKSDSPKQLVSVRYSQEVLTYFKSTGEGWQARMDGVLQEYVIRQSGRAQR